jgi:hypothetical protein
MTLLDELEALGPDGLDRYVEDVRRRIATQLPPDLVNFGVLMVLAHVLHECANEVERARGMMTMSLFDELEALGFKLVLH